MSEQSTTPDPLTEERIRAIAAEAAGHAVTAIVNARTRAIHEQLIAHARELRDGLDEIEKQRNEMVRMFNANVIAMDARVKALEEAAR
jgi:hypothetical protein